MCLVLPVIPTHITHGEGGQQQVQSPFVHELAPCLDLILVTNTATPPLSTTTLVSFPLGPVFLKSPSVLRHQILRGNRRLYAVSLAYLLHTIRQLGMCGVRFPRYRGEIGGSEKRVGGTTVADNGPVSQQGILINSGLSRTILSNTSPHLRRIMPSVICDMYMYR